MPTASILRNPLLSAIAPTAVGRWASRRLMRPATHPPRRWEQTSAAQARPVTFRFGLRGMAWGTHGPLVLALHGWEGRPTQFAPLVAPLLDAGMRVVALAAPSHGSPGPELMHPFAFADAALEAAAELGPLHAAIGHSMGAAALLYAAEQGLAVDRLVAVSAPVALRRFLRRTARAWGLGAQVAQAFQHAYDRSAGIAAEQMDLIRIGPALRQPVLLVHDQDDPGVPQTDVIELRQTWPAAYSLTTVGLGHNRVLADPVVITAVTRFLAPSGVGAGDQKSVAGDA